LGPKRMHGDVERDDKDYTMGVIGPFEFDNIDKSKPIYIGLKAQRYILTIFTTLVDPAKTPFDHAGGAYGHYYNPGQWPSNIFYYGLDKMFTYIVKDNIGGSFRTYVREISEIPIEHNAWVPEQCGEGWSGQVYLTTKRYHRGITPNDAIAGGTVSPDKYKYLDVLYTEVSWSDFIAYHEEWHIIESSYPNPEKIAVVDFNLLYALKTHYTGESGSRSCPCHSDSGVYTEYHSNEPPPSEPYVSGKYATTFGFSQGTFDKQDAFLECTGSDCYPYHCDPADEYSVDCGLAWPVLCCLYDYPVAYITNFDAPSGQAYMEVDDEVGSNFSEKSISGGYSWDYWLVLMACTDFAEIVSCVTASKSESFVGSSEPTPIYWF